MATGTIHKFGTLYIDGKPFQRPTKPWFGTNGSAPEEGNLYELNMDQFGGDASIHIGNSYSNDAYKLQWVEINDGDEQIFICDRNIMCKASLDFLKAQGLAGKKGSGTIVKIDNKSYELFMLSGGSTWNASSESSYTNEWNKYIVNMGSFSGLVKPSSEDLDDSNSSRNFSTPHNNVWHWAGCYSWCCENINNTNIFPNRGMSGAKSWTSDFGTTTMQSIGWRPALRAANAAPTITPSSKNLGNISTPQNISYSISDPNGEQFNVVVKLDEAQKESYQSQTDKSYTFNMSQYWSSIGLGNHTVKIIATDINGDSTEASYTFNRTNASPTISPAYSSLGELSSPRDITYTVNDPENDTLTIVVKIDNNEKERHTNQSNGQRTFVMSKYWGTLGIGSHEVKIEVTDIFAHKAVATYNFTKKNTTPDPPRIISPLNNSRVGSDFYVEFYIGSDPEGDTQRISVQVSDSTNWSGATTFNSLEKYSNGQWVTANFATNLDVNTKFRIKVTGVTKSKYFRIVSLDQGSQASVYSSNIHVKFGSVLEVKTHPTETSACIQKAIVLLDLVADSKVKKEIFVSNNANDASPVWEAYTPDSAGNHTFSNNTKTASKWAVATKLKLTANDSTGEIAVRAIGMGVI